MTCPYVSGLLPQAERALASASEDVLVAPSGCDAMRRCGDLLAAGFPGRVLTIRVPRTAKARAVATFASELRVLMDWLDQRAYPAPRDLVNRATATDSTGQDGGGEWGTTFPFSPYQPGGVFLISGPLDGKQLFELFKELGASLSGLDSCSSAQREESLAVAWPLAADEPDLLGLSRAVLTQTVCPRRPASERLAYLRSRLLEAKPVAVVYARQSFCDPAAYDALGLARLAAELSLPFLEVEVGLPLEVTGPLRTRVEAFLETLLLEF